MKSCQSGQTKTRNDGAFVRVTVNTDERHIDEANKLVELFAQRILALLPNFWPMEK